MPEPIKPYLDEDTINRRLITALRSRWIDLVTAREAAMIAVPDAVQLDYTTSLGRTVLTFNTRDFVRLHTEYVSGGSHHAGIIVSDQAQVGDILRRVLKLLGAHNAEDMRDWLEYLSNWR